MRLFPFLWICHSGVHGTLTKQIQHFPLEWLRVHAGKRRAAVVELAGDLLADWALFAHLLSHGLLML